MEASSEKPKTALGQRIAALSPAKRALLERALARKSGLPPGDGLSTGDTRSTPVALSPQPDNHAAPQLPPPMSFGQQGMWLLHQTLPDPAAYNSTTAWRLAGQVDPKAVRRCFQVIQARHAVLRTALVQQETRLVQLIQPADGALLPWQAWDLRAVQVDQQEAVLADRLRAESRRPFDLAQSPLWRVVWVDLGEAVHVLACVFHHSIMDEWSMRLFAQEFTGLYAAGGETHSAGLPELPMQYADFAVWQRQRLTGKFLEQRQTYWREQLRHLPPALELPGDLPRPAQPSGQGATHRFKITRPVVRRFRELARANNTTVFTVALAAFQVWLHRYTGQKDIVVGTPITGRERPEVQSLIGYFLNTLPIRMRLDGSLTFQEVLRELRPTVLDAFSHAELPFEQTVELVVKERKPGLQPLYQVMFVLLEEGLPHLKLGDVRAEPFSVGTQTNKNDLIWNISAGGPIWDCQLEYSMDLFSAESVARMARHLTALLESIADDPQLAISHLRLMSGPERHQLLVEWNAGGQPYPQAKCIHELFEEQVRRTPEAVALVFDDSTITYGELNQRADQLANHLRNLGVRPETLVGLLVERSPLMVVGLMGILKAGGAYVPMDPKYPQARLTFMMEDAKPLAVVTQQSLLNLLPAHEAHVVCLDSSGRTIQPAPGGNQVKGLRPGSNNLAYIIYTSGSTGRPKGVAIEHRSAVNFIHWGLQAFSDEEMSGVLASTSVCFDLSIFELLVTLSRGGRVIIAENALQLPQLAAKAQVTLINTVPSAMAELLKAGGVPPGVRVVNLAGEPLPTSLVDRIYAQKNVRKVNDLYGPTETTTYSTFTLRHPGLRPTIGRPIANTQVYILDGTLQLVPVGVAGELHIGGDGLARGYMNRPELTAEKFIANPFSEEPGARIYKTGDLCRYRADGNIEYLGRMDQQVKIRGFRIELGEVESILGTHPDVGACAVVTQGESAETKLLAAFVVLKDSFSPESSTGVMMEQNGRQTIASGPASCEKNVLSPDSLRAWLDERLPNYVVPSRFTVLEKLPLAPNGKVDRQTLAKMAGADFVATDDYVEPRTELEWQLAVLWEKVFGRDHIGVRDNFFTLGGHSLQAVRLVANIEKLLGRKLPIALLFQTPTIESLARRFTDEKWAPAWSSLVPLQPQGAKPPVFFVHGWGGDVYDFLNLAKLLPPDQPCYGIQAVGLDGKSTRHVTVEDMATHYVKEILSFQPEGAVYLAGYSMGGSIAYEIAQQLHRRGRKVAMLGILDSVPVGALPWSFYALKTITYLPRRCWFHIRHCWGLPPGEYFNYFRGRWKTLRYWLRRNFSKAPVIVTPPPMENLAPKVPGYEDYYEAVGAAYRLRPYSGSADIFLSDAVDSTWRLYWRYMVRGGCFFHHVKGCHSDIISSPEHVSGLAKALTKVLQRAQENERDA